MGGLNPFYSPSLNRLLLSLIYEKFILDLISSGKGESGERWIDEMFNLN
jgi:hypothetical protein